MLRTCSLRLAVVLGLAAAGCWSNLAVAADPTFELTIRNHRFEPDTLNVPANTRIQLIVLNDDAQPEEFESHDLNVEKVIPGKNKGTINIGPLKPGTYKFVGEFHEDTAKGSLVAK